MTRKTRINPLAKLVVLTLLISSCVSHRDYIIDSDYSYDGNFRKYKTFDFIRNASQDTLHNTDLVKTTMQNRLGAQGYKKTEHKPDLLIMYKIFYDDFYLRGYNQPKFESWVGTDSFLNTDQSKTKTANVSNLDRYYDDDEEARSGEYMEQRYCMHEGTLLVIFYDRKRKKTVWQGYASGVFSRADGRSDRHIKAATSKIFNEFRLLADGFLLKG
ncbi:MAG: DUF4136 domain-containing protein [Cyclobacteriaceae bacterium]